MSIQYEIIRRKNPQDFTSTPKYYAAVKANRSVDFESLAELISEQCTLTDTDCLEYLILLVFLIIKYL